MSLLSVRLRPRALVLMLCIAMVLTLCFSAGCGGGKARGPSAERGSSSTGGPVTGVSRIYQKLSPSVVAVLVQRANGAGEGSGVAFEPRRIVTNNHVVEGGEQITVALASGERIPATVVARDALTDLAVLSVGRDLPPAAFAEKLPPVGSLAVAIGSPLGFEGSVTAGVLSGVDRSIPSGGTTPQLVNLLQTDAAISPGNSGGALAGADGKVMGINVAYIPPAASAVSIGFSIPAPTVSDVVGQLIRSGKVEHAYLGVQMEPLPAEVAGALGVNTDGGAVIRAVVKDGPAARAGLRVGDIITRVAGRPAEQVEDVLAALRATRPGARLQLEILRDGQRRTVSVRVGKRPAP